MNITCTQSRQDDYGKENGERRKGVARKKKREEEGREEGMEAEGRGGNRGGMEGWTVRKMRREEKEGESRTSL